MKIILEISSFTLIKKISTELEEIFDYTKIKGQTILCSNILDKSGNPIARIDSKKPCKGIILKINSKSIEIKSIVNSTSEKGLSKKIIEILIDNLPKDFKIIIDQDVSGGFWDKIIQQYPKVNFEKK